ncbi:MAG: helix-turn-helix domain-containing protein [Prevotella sp.]|nr:helix-turn-helix domain-containing protein [Prevotella sp.]
MVKYNVRFNSSKDATYCTLVNPKLVRNLKTKIINRIEKKKKYREKKYSAKNLAKELGTNSRYISAVLNIAFGMNYATFVNKYRIEESKKLLVDKENDDLTMEEISDMVGFSNRQTFYASFYKFEGVTPRQYKLEHTK